ncbi:MAG: 23S rRNA (adenine(2030)-N(6))-methyltransferase RlmJ [Treponema sp.]|uniref:23S rRNA (adenine(2030)-N(6))-methyltransferase RlmJ n=1 Tax=Treponema sp. TaxID=166 RepID=UPI00298E1713|nr:23S rRNA (adenine(2030)-N(6))-methyltransferase RlmJ [Treponema sp.]MCR5387268.1 23S rRNA (adenine(2030)-N(6))-methyltransferase RlmJ [Treponema sp.]
MLSYRHAFHAGNHADILKHTVLINILESLNLKDKPYTVFDTHAGSGIYSLQDERSKKTGEAELGIIPLLREMNNIDFPESLSNYFKICELYKKHDLYPGSIEFEKIFTGKSCAHIVMELNNSEIDLLNENASRETLVSLSRDHTQVKTQVHHADGLKDILALSPPAIKRGFCLVDPSYEEADEYGKTGNAVININKKWNVAVIALWYPLLAHRIIEIEAMKKNIIACVKSRNDKTEIMDAKFLVNKEDSHTETSLKDNSGPPRLYGSGMLVINMPWKLDEKTKDNLSYIAKKIYKNESTSWSVEVF